MLITSTIYTRLPTKPDARIQNTPVLYDELVSLYTAIQALHKEATQNTRVIAIYDEVVLEGQAVNIYLSGGAVHARLAKATSLTYMAIGFCGKGGAAIGQATEVLFNTVNTYLTGLVAGTLYYLSTSAGLITTIKPASVGNIVQPVGWAFSSDTLFYAPNNLPLQL